MLLNYCYDLILNFLDYYCPFYEWDKNDSFDYVEKIPIFRVTTDDIFNLCNYEIIIDNLLLNKIENETILKNDLLDSIEYACVFTDTFNSIAIEFDKNGRSILKSYFLIEDDIRISKLSKKFDINNIKYKVLDKTICNKELKQITNIKNDLVNMIDIDFEEHNDDKIIFLYMELFNKNIDDVGVAYHLLKEKIVSCDSFEILKLFKYINCV